MGNSIIHHFSNTWRPFKQIEDFSENPGIYAVHFNGVQFPLDSAMEEIQKGDIIYLGKTLSSQKERDADSHF